jgi:hypothetical protein
MKDSQRNKLNMYVLVRDYLLASVTITNKIAVLAALISTFNDYITEIFAISEQQERDQTGVTQTKKSLRAALIAQMEKITRKCVAYASGVNDVVLLQMIRFTPSQLKAMADADLVKKAEDMVTVITPKLADVAGYNITASDLESLSGLKTDFVSIYTAPTGNKKSKSQLTEKLNALFGSTDAVLEKIDDQVGALYDTDPDFFAEYNKKRVLVKLSKRQRAFQMWITDAETGQPIKKAVVKLVNKTANNGLKAATSSGADLTKNVKKAGAQGGLIENSMPAGEYAYEVSYGGYVTQTGSFFVNDGQMTEVRVLLRSARNDASLRSQ